MKREKCQLSTGDSADDTEETFLIIRLTADNEEVLARKSEKK